MGIMMAVEEEEFKAGEGCANGRGSRIDVTERKGEEMDTD